MACTSPNVDHRAVAPYGTWESPLDAARVTGGSLRLDQLAADGDDLYWLEGRASEGGRNVLVKRTPDGRIADVTPPDFNVRTRVHEYGGAAYLVHRGTVYFSNFADQRLYRHQPGEAPAPLTREGYFFGDCEVDEPRARLVCVREDHTRGDAEPPNEIVAIDLSAGAGDAQAGRVLVSGADFYSDPIVSPDGRHLAWLEWRHPNMPWDGTELWRAEIAADGSLQGRERIAGSATESIFQPEWSPDGELYFVSDRTGWWNLYRLRNGAADAVHPMPAEFGRAQWVLGMRTYGFITARRLAVTYTQDGQWKLALIETEPRKFEPVALALQPARGMVATSRAVYFIGGSPTQAPAVAEMTLAAAEARVIRSSTTDAIEPAWISVPEAITYSSDGHDVHAFYYPPTNPNVRAPEGDKPPLIVIGHGGPTDATGDLLESRLQFWTSRGFAVLDVNYRGSTGYGRDYRDALKGQWGIADVADAVNGARHLVAEGKADPNRLAIRGGSAGGYTALAAVTFHKVFRAAASYYGVSDIEVLARDTHKFESRYLDSLVGPYPEKKNVYIERSPIHAADRLSAALILLQGLEDKVVPPNQSEMMAEAARKKGLPVAYVAFEGEQHGFRKAANIIRSLESELYFYGRVFGFTPAGPLPPIEIENLP